MRTVYHYCYDQMADFETVLLLHRLRAFGDFRILSVAESREPVRSQSGLVYLPDLTIPEASAEQAEAIILPGGPIRNEQNAILPLLQRMHAGGRLIAAICFAPQFPARAGLLAGRSYTTSCTEEHLRQQGLRDPFPREGFRDLRVVEDGCLITAQGHAFIDFAEAVCRRLGLDPDREPAMFGRIRCDA
jgi:putative intracellular protease/amidase